MGRKERERQRFERSKHTVSCAPASGLPAGHTESCTVAQQQLARHVKKPLFFVPDSECPDPCTALRRGQKLPGAVAPDKSQQLWRRRHMR